MDTSNEKYLKRILSVADFLLQVGGFFIVHNICDLRYSEVMWSTAAYFRGCVGCKRTLLQMLSALFSNIKRPFLPIIPYQNYNAFKSILQFSFFYKVTS